MQREACRTQSLAIANGSNKWFTAICRYPSTKLVAVMKKNTIFIQIETKSNLMIQNKDFQKLEKYINKAEICFFGYQ